MIKMKLSYKKKQKIKLNNKCKTQIRKYNQNWFKRKIFNKTINYLKKKDFK